MKRIDEILALPHSADDFKNLELPPSDDDSWLYGGEDELNTYLQERQKEMENFNTKQKKKHKSKEQEASGKDFDEFDLGGIAKSMQSFIEKVSSYEGAEFPEDRLVLFLLHFIFVNVNLFFSSYMKELIFYLCSVWKLFDNGVFFSLGISAN